MPRPNRWRDLLPGLAATLTLAAIVVGVLLFARVGALRGDTIRLVVLAGSARELLAGSEVWLAGRKVGIVEAIEFRSASSDPATRLAISLEVLASARPQLRTDTRAEFKAGGSFLGAPIVSLTGGSAAAPRLEDGDTLRAVPDLDPQTFAAGFAEAGRDLPALRTNVAALVGQMRGSNGTVGAAMSGDAVANGRALAARLDRLASALTEPRGTVGRVMTDRGALRPRIDRARASADSLRRALDAPSGTFGRFRRDSTLAEQIAGVQAEIAAVRALVDRPAGTAGRAVHDAVLVEELAQLERQLELLIADVKAQPFRYIVF